MTVNVTVGLDRDRMQQLCTPLWQDATRLGEVQRMITRERDDARCKQLRRTDRDLRQQIDDSCEPIWQMLVDSDIPSLVKLGRQRPKVLRHERSFALAQVMPWVSCEAHGELLLAWVRDMQHHAGSGLWFLDDEKLQAAERWAEAHPGQLRVQLKRGGLIDAVQGLVDWCADQDFREDLAPAGKPIARLSCGTVRLMPSSSFEALGEYLSCCIGDDARTYGERADKHISAFVCVYSPKSGLPVGLAELRCADDGTIYVEESQSRFARGGDDWLGQLTDWISRPEACAELCAALGTTPGTTEIVDICADAQEIWFWEDEGDVTTPKFGQRLDFNYDAAIEAVVEGYASYTQIMENIRDYLGHHEAAQFRQQLIDSCSTADNGLAGLVAEMASRSR